MKKGIALILIYNILSTSYMVPVFLTQNSMRGGGAKYVPGLSDNIRCPYFSKIKIFYLFL